MKEKKSGNLSVAFGFEKHRKKMVLNGSDLNLEEAAGLWTATSTVVTVLLSNLALSLVLACLKNTTQFITLNCIGQIHS